MHVTEGRRNRTKIRTTILLAVLVLSLALITVFLASFGDRADANPTRIACVGDSITELSTYPDILQSMLGTNYEVRNFGVSGATVLRNSYTPYIEQEEFQKAKDFLPNIVVILLGTNDARADTYQSIDKFAADYKQLITELQALESKPKILLVKPPPIFSNNLYLSNTNLVSGVIPRIEQVAVELALTVIDVYTPLANHPEYFMDGVHPDIKGAKVIAGEIFKAI